VKLCLGMSAVVKLLHKQREQAMYLAKSSLMHCKMRMAWRCMHEDFRHFMLGNTLGSLTQPCLTAYCICCNTSMIQPFYQALHNSVSLGKCIWDPIYQGTHWTPAYCPATLACAAYMLDQPQVLVWMMQISQIYKLQTAQRLLHTWNLKPIR